MTYPSCLLGAVAGDVIGSWLLKMTNRTPPKHASQKRLAVLLLSVAFLVVSLSCSLFSPGGDALKFEPDNLPAAELGADYETEIHVTQNRTPVGDFSIAKGALPEGLELTIVEGEADTARISGVPQEAGTFTFTLSVWCYGTNVSGQTGEKEYSLVVED